MKTKTNKMITYTKAHPIIAGVLSIFAVSAIAGLGIMTFTLVQPSISDAFSEGPPCCGGGPGIIIDDPDPVVNPGFPGFPGDGGGGGGPVPDIPTCELNVASGTLTLGDSSTLSWTTTNAAFASINQGIGSVTVPSGSRDVSPTTDVTYTMTVTSSTGHTAVCSDSIVVEAPNTIPVCTLTASDLSLTAGESATISWTTQNATQISLQHLDAVTPNLNASGSITTQAPGTYTLRASDDDGDSVTCEVTITVVIPDAPVCTFTASKTALLPGESATLTWTTQNATEVHLQHLDAITPDMPLNGSITTQALGVHTITAISATGDSVDCTVTLTRITIPDAPVCTFTASKTALLPGESATLTWTTQNATEVYLQHLDAITPDMPLNGSVTTQALGTYTISAVSAAGDSVDCTVTLTRITIPDAPVCTFVAEDTTLLPGQSTTLTWTTQNATEVHLQHLDAITPDMPLNGSITTQALGVHTITAISATGDSVDCVVELVRVTENTLACTLDVEPNSIREGGNAEITWTTDNAVSFTINGEAKDLDGDEGINNPPVGTHTYTGVATDASGNTVECTDSLLVSGGSGGSGPVCTLSFDPTAIRTGGSSTLTWTTQRATSVSIDRGIGAVDQNGNTTITPTANGSFEYVLTARNNSGQEATCRATLTVSGGSGGGCTQNCGGGSTPGPNVTIDFLKGPGEQPLAFITLSQIPYTGIELGPIGTVLYWIVLITWSGAVAYLVLFKFIPFSRRKLSSIGDVVKDAVNATEGGTIEAPPMREEMEDIQMDEGFTPRPTEDTLSVEDIVRGLSSRMEREAHSIEKPSFEEEVPAPEYEEEPFIEEEFSTPPAEERVAPIAQAAPVTGDELRFLNALMAGDRDTTFSILRRSVRNGGRPDLLIEQVLVHLDSAYRARTEGAYCSEDVRRMCASSDTALLEEVISALAAAVDTTYSQAQTGVKLAVARALQVIERG